MTRALTPAPPEEFSAGGHLPGRIWRSRAGALSIRVRPRTLLICGILALIAAALGIGVLMTGSLGLGAGEVWAALTGRGEPRAERVVLTLRLPRLVAGLCVGACLGVAGAVFQSLSRNPLGSPDIIGFVSGAATGAIIQIVVLGGGPVAVALSAVASGLITAALVYALSFRGRATGGYRLILVGIGVGAVLQALNSLLLTRSAEDTAILAQLWLTGSLNARNWGHALPVAAALILLLPVLLLAARRINMIELGDDLGQQLGVHVESTRLIMMSAAVGMTAVAVAAAGPISFVALAAPHVVRQLTRSPTIPLLPSALMGAVLLVAADLASQHLPFGLAVPVGLLTGLFGGFYLLWLLARSARL